MKYIKKFEGYSLPSTEIDMIGTKVGDIVVYSDEEEPNFSILNYGDKYIVLDIFGLDDDYKFGKKDEVNSNGDYFIIKEINDNKVVRDDRIGYLKIQANRFTPEYKWNAKKYNI